VAVCAIAERASKHLAFINMEANRLLREPQRGAVRDRHALTIGGVLNKGRVCTAKTKPDTDIEDFED
jgi:hypothetical protein